MINVLRVRNVNDALAGGLWHLRTNGVQEGSRNGPVLVSPGPFITEYEYPTERVLFEPRRDCNPVFHLMEALWMLGGYQDVRWLLQFNSKFDQFAEDGVLMHGAYGHRWRKLFGLDQIRQVTHMLKMKPDTRQAVVAMWSPSHDLMGNWLDRPCNTHIYFDRRGGKLNMMVNCRSNDMLWGAYGSNVVHFSMLQELIAHELGIPVGTYWQNSFNFHVYMSLPMARDLLRNPSEPEEYDQYHAVRPWSLLTSGETMYQFMMDCETLVSGGRNMNTSFMRHVAYPLMVNYVGRKKDPSVPVAWESIAECDWKLAFQQWCARREEKKHD